MFLFKIRIRFGSCHKEKQMLWTVMLSNCFSRLPHWVPFNKKRSKILDFGDGIEVEWHLSEWLETQSNQCWALLCSFNKTQSPEAHTKGNFPLNTLWISNFVWNDPIQIRMKIFLLSFPHKKKNIFWVDLTEVKNASHCWH